MTLKSETFFFTPLIFYFDDIQPPPFGCMVKAIQIIEEIIFKIWNSKRSIEIRRYLV